MGHERPTPNHITHTAGPTPNHFSHTAGIYLACLDIQDTSLDFQGNGHFMDLNIRWHAPTGVFITEVFSKRRSPQYRATPFILTVPSAHSVLSESCNCKLGVVFSQWWRFSTVCTTYTVKGSWRPPLTCLNGVGKQVIQTRFPYPGLHKALQKDWAIPRAPTSGSRATLPLCLHNLPLPLPWPPPL